MPAASVLNRLWGLGKGLEKALAPPIDVVILDGSTESLHPALFFALRHGQASMDGIGQVFEIIGIHDNCVF